MLYIGHETKEEKEKCTQLFGWEIARSETAEGRYTRKSEDNVTTSSVPVIVFLCTTVYMNTLILFS
jgi:hypothetical protein